MTARAARSRKIAILIPTYNGGALLQETVDSGAAAGMPADSYEVLVSDNSSDDGSAERLAAHDRQGAPVHVRKNERNLGRVENWNRAIDYAEELGFGFAIFLMVGDNRSGYRPSPAPRSDAAAPSRAGYRVLHDRRRAPTPDPHRPPDSLVRRAGRAGRGGALPRPGLRDRRDALWAAWCKSLSPGPSREAALRSGRRDPYRSAGDGALPPARRRERRLSRRAGVDMAQPAWPLPTDR